MRSRVAAAVVIAAAVALSGCASADVDPTPMSPAEDSVTPSPPVPSTPPATPEPAVTAPPAAVTSIPPCADLLTLEEVRAASGNLERVGIIEDSTYAIAEGLPGPLAQSLFEGASPTSVCAWGIPQSDGAVHLGVALLDASPRDRLIEALQNSQEYSATSVDDMPVFSRRIDQGIGASVAYVFRDDVWTIVSGTLVSADSAAELAISAMRSVWAG